MPSLAVDLNEILCSTLEVITALGVCGKVFCSANNE
jgi:hypothetical protein